MKKLRAALLIAIPPIVGGLSALLSGDKSMGGYKTPPLSPPEWLFPIVWAILYLLLGIASYLAWRENDFKLDESLKYFYYSLALNFIWPILFFRYKLYAACVVLLAVMFITSLAAAKDFWERNKAAGYLYLPYLVWLVFAEYLNIGVAVLNS